jgi:GH25 family lysozyme M1 (1,4-beta-N-acetylmuramidase)
MNTKMKIVTAIAVVSTVVAVIEGVLLVQRPAYTPPAVVAQGPAAENPAKNSRAVQVAARSHRKPMAAPVAPPLPEEEVVPYEVVTPATAVAAATDSATGTAASAAPEPVLTAEEKAAKEKALAKAKFEEAMTLQMEQAAKQMIDRLQLNDGQKQQAAPTLEKLRQAMIQMAMGPMKAAQDMQQKAQEMQQAARLAGQTEEQIAAQLKSERDKMMQQVQDQVTGNLSNVSSTLEELRPVLDTQQAGTLDQMKKEIQQQQAMMKKMMGAMAKPEESGAADNPTP